MFKVKLLPVILLAAALLTVAACTGTGNPQDTFDTRGPVARGQADIFNFVFAIAIVVFVIVEGALIYISLRYRNKKGDALPAQVHGNTKLEVTWTIIPAIIIAIIAVPTISGIWTNIRPPEDGLVVEAVGHQWWFEFRYPEQGIITANEMHIPAEEDILIDLEAQDVIHSFWVPKLGGKLDMVPLKENRLWLRAAMPENDAPTEVFYGQCAEFCGVAHAHMKFRVIVHTPENFSTWSAQWFNPPEAPAAGSAEAEGRLLFIQNCSTCHSYESHSTGSYDTQVQLQDQRWFSWENDPDGSLLVSAPDLTHFGERLTIGAGEDPLNRESLIAWIKDPSSIKPGTRMQQNASVYRVDPQRANDRSASPSIQLTDAEVASMADFLLSLKPGSASGDTE